MRRASPLMLLLAGPLWGQAPVPADGPSCGLGTTAPQCAAISGDRSLDPGQTARDAFNAVTAANDINPAPPFYYRGDLPTVRYDCVRRQIAPGSSSASATFCDGQAVGVFAGSKLFDIASNCSANNPGIRPPEVVAAALAHELGHIVLHHGAEGLQWQRTNCATTPDPAQNNWFSYLASRGDDENEEAQRRLAEVRALPADQRGRAALQFEREICMRYKQASLYELIRRQERAADDYACQAMCRLMRSRRMVIHPGAGACLFRSMMDLDYMFGHDTVPAELRNHPPASARAISASECWARACP